MALTPQRLKFSFDAARAVQAACYIATRCPDLTKLKLMKLLYFADKRHLQLWGRPITGDRFIRMEHGPVASAFYDLVKRSDMADAEAQSIFDGYLTVHGNSVKAEVDPNLNDLSASDVEVLDEVLAQYGRYSAPQLSKISHSELAWQKAPANGEMDLRLCLREENSDDAVRQLVEEDQRLQSALEDIDFEDVIAGLRT